MPDPGKPVVLITKLKGWIGDAIVRVLHSDYDVASLTRSGPTNELTSRIHPLRRPKTTASSAALDRALRRHGPKIASVVHLAAYYDFSESRAACTRT